MIPLQSPYRPVTPVALVTRRTQTLKGPKMSGLGDMTMGDWGMLLGAAVVGGAGLNGLRNQFFGKKKPKKIDAIGVLLSGIFATVGLSLVVTEAKKAIA